MNYISGDFNIDCLKDGMNKKEIINLLLNFDLRLLINGPTRITPKTASDIDNIITNNDNVIDSGIMTTALSDHEGVFVAFIHEYLKNQVKSYPNQTAKPHLNNGSSVEYFKYMLNKENWDEVFSCHDVNEAYDKFLSIYSFC